ncbi:MAG: hypothetical protein E6Q87_02280 [Cellvibrionales bacterium]|nr:MAG: hypothetical protein E6Q87_02280 [Cellvibrionales bacterium]
MESRLIIQPSNAQLGMIVSEMLDDTNSYRRIFWLSAFVSLRTILRLRDRLLHHLSYGCEIKIVVGIDLFGTSREVLEELLLWGCDVYVFQDSAPRSTFHPKAYLFESAESATILIGSNNLTEGGFFTNHEVSACMNYYLPEDSALFQAHSQDLDNFLLHEGNVLHHLTRDLIDVLAARGQIPTEDQARKARRKSFSREQITHGPLPPNPFGSLGARLPPLVSFNNRIADADVVMPVTNPEPDVDGAQILSERMLVWRKVLPASDALQVREGTNTVGGVRLTQARFEAPAGQRIDQTTYFRILFEDFRWESENTRNADQEHTFVPIRIVIRGIDYGIRNFEISHKPSGEAGQDNYTTILRWGRDFTLTIRDLNLTGCTLSLYETNEQRAPFLIEID